MGVIGYHPASLPGNRGRHPIIWALVLGLKQSSSTFFFMDEGADSGDILSQVDFNIAAKDTARTIYDKLSGIARNQVKEFIKELKTGRTQRIQQDESESAYRRKRVKEDGKIDFRMSSDAICNLVRGLTHPYCGAHIVYRNREFKVWQIENAVDKRPVVEPGKVLAIQGDRVKVKTYDGAVVLIDHELVQLPSKGDYIY